MNFTNIKLNYSLYYLLLLAFFAALLLTPINLTNQDLGRHLTNGREVINQHWSVLFSNHYSYTQPQKEVVNHHWLSGVVFFLIKQAIGFKGLHLTHILIYCGALLFLLLILNQQTNNQWLSLTASIPAAMLLASRSEIRPETFGYLFLAHSLWQLGKMIEQRKITTVQVVVLAGQQILWANLHISWAFALFVFILAWALAQLDIKPVNRLDGKQLLLLITALTASSLLTPNLIKGLLQPLTIFIDYGYEIVENKNLLYLLRVINLPMIYYWAIVAILYLSLLVTQPTKKMVSFYSILAGVGIALAFIALRNMPILVIFSFPYLSQRLQQVFDKLEIKVNQPKIARSIFFLLTLLSAACISLYHKLNHNQFRLGLKPGQNQAAQFLRKHPPTNPIFNNYDLGSYLIYHLFPDSRVFVDNRPEAYGEDFFQTTYIPAQLSETKWRELNKRYQFQTLIIGVKDITPWNRTFVKKRLKDSAWQTAFQDEFCLIMEKSPQNNSGH